MSIDLERLGDLALDSLKDDGEAAWDEFDADQKEVVERSIREYAKLMARRLTHPDEADALDDEIGWIKSTLATHGWIVAMRVERRIKAALLNALIKVGTAALAAL